MVEMTGGESRQSVFVVVIVVGEGRGRGEGRRMWNQNRGEELPSITREIAWSRSPSLLGLSPLDIRILW